LVISLNSVYLGIDADYNSADSLVEADVFFIVSEVLFCVYFVFEWIVRFSAFQHKKDCLKDGWFKFDSLLVFLMVAETAVLPIVSSELALPTAPLRLLRLARLSRLVRLVKSLPDLLIIMKGMAYSIRAVASSLAMAVLMMYVFAIILHMLLSAEEDMAEEFSTLPRCMWTLLIDGLLLCNTHHTLGELVHQGKFHTTAAVITFILFIGIGGYTIMNMLVGIIV